MKYAKYASGRSFSIVLLIVKKDNSYRKGLLIKKMYLFINIIFEHITKRHLEGTF